MKHCPNCDTEGELIPIEERVTPSGEHRPEWSFRCPNEDCRVGGFITGIA